MTMATKKQEMGVLRRAPSSKGGFAFSWKNLTVTSNLFVGIAFWSLAVMKVVMMETSSMEMVVVMPASWNLNGCARGPGEICLNVWRLLYVGIITWMKEKLVIMGTSTMEMVVVPVAKLR